MHILDGKTILITGGTGSFGNAFINFAKDYDTNFVIYSRDEKKQHDMFVERMDDRIHYVIGDIRDKNKLTKYLDDVDYVLHAAALKHVPTGENFPEEVIKTNIYGIQNVIEASEECNVEKVINLSTDKAVYPINAYGMSKAIAEKIIAAHNRNTTCVNLRYGNVIGSRGSVIPLFLSQIRNKKPLTITDYDMTRFLLPLSHAVALALKCLEKGKNGDLFVIKPPACNIRNLIRALELFFNKEFEKKIIGIRPGEKIDETLLTPEELVRSIEIAENGILYVRVPKLKANIGDYFYSGAEAKVPKPFTSSNTVQLDPIQVLSMIQKASLLPYPDAYILENQFSADIVQSQQIGRV